ncbi:signal transduction histidine kinase [Gorgonomyces haynaldii]|nr:signal transduction histidine kinase [Gorgonomyces haynaldii]
MTTVIDDAVFQQILELDNEGDEDFSRSLLQDFFSQAQTTLEQLKQSLNKALSNKDELGEISRMGHFLKGSAASLGFVKIRYDSEQLQYLGKLQRPDGASISYETAIDEIRRILEHVPSLLGECQQCLAEKYKRQI